MGKYFKSALEGISLLPVLVMEAIVELQEPGMGIPLWGMYSY